ncbi:signal peptidase I [Streptomyces sp. NPDC057011]|uniref:signal peptidase I n=1 Tax=unclassified Streptomyces TaxID=2593676 RepID=UPI00363A5E06
MPNGKRNRIRRSISGLLWWVACVAMVLSVGGSAWAYYVEQYRYVPILTSSMEPEIRKGALIITEPVLARDMNPGDVIAFSPPEPWTRPGGLPVVHRIDDLQRMPGGEASMTTRGDANDSPDPWTIDLSGGEFAKVVHEVPHLGGWIVLLRSIGLLPLLALAVGVVLLWYAVRRVVAARRRRA